LANSVHQRLRSFRIESASNARRVKEKHFLINRILFQRLLGESLRLSLIAILPHTQYAFISVWIRLRIAIRLIEDTVSYCKTTLRG
jgi:hypothetical protein